MKIYWFYLESYTFLFVKNEFVLVYNSLSKEREKFKLNEKLAEIISELLKSENMYCIELSESELSDLELKKFIHYVRNSFSGDLVDKSLMINKPLLIIPELNLQKKVDKLRNDKYRSWGEEIKSYLSEVSIYLGGVKSDSSFTGTPVYKQFDYCRSSNEPQLPLSSIKLFLDQIKLGSVHTINIVGGNIFTYADLKSLIDILEETNVSKVLYIHLNDVINNANKLDLFNHEQFTLKILIDFPIHGTELDLNRFNLNTSSINTEWLFAICSIEDFMEAERLIEKFKLEKAEIKPVFTGSNQSFFEEFIYINEDDVKSIQPNRREIFANQTINAYDFGKLTIMEDGKVFSNINQPSIGEIMGSVTEIIYNEMDKGTSWLRIRNQGYCNDCVYQYLCPSPSNYEIVIGTENLCHINN
jgi:pseudo-rSAM protein